MRQRNSHDADRLISIHAQQVDYVEAAPQGPLLLVGHVAVMGERRNARSSFAC